VKANQAPAQSVDDYIKSFPKSTRDRLNQIHRLVLKTLPKAEEKVSYGMPAYRFNGAYRFYFAGYDKHIGVYVADLDGLDMDAKVKPYRTGKATLRFANEQPLPIDLIEEMLLKISG
jgi:uncharacterized protein YdhG (YjbR/CyaY superfamily)